MSQDGTESIESQYRRFLKGEIIPGDFIKDRDMGTVIGVVIGECKLGSKKNPFPAWLIRRANGEQGCIDKMFAVMLGYGL
jgi:hypothetical protein